MSIENEAAAVVTDDPAAEGHRTRLCGRCRQPSERNPSDPPAAEAPWWLCPPCREALIGGVGRGHRT